MPLIPVAAFLAGALLTLLLPVLLLIGLVIWYDVIIRRRGEPAEVSDLGRSGAEASGTAEAGPAPEGGTGSQTPSGA